jgi:hypothetical protein
MRIQRVHFYLLPVRRNVIRSDLLHDQALAVIYGMPKLHGRMRTIPAYWATIRARIVVVSVTETTVCMIDQQHRVALFGRKDVRQ